MATHHIFLVEDDAPLRVSLTRLLEISGYCVSGFETAEDLLGNLSKSNSEVRPHCIVLDVNLPGLSGVVLQERLRKMQIDCAVIFISAELNAHHVNSAWRDGASDFIFKPFQPEALLKAIAKALHKNSVDGSDLHSDSNARRHSSVVLKHAKLIHELTPRQQQVLLMLVDGYSNTQIAEQLEISPRTVKMHREGLMQRLDIKHITELARIYEQCKHLINPT